MENDSDPRMVVEDRRDVVVGLAGVYHRRLAAVCRDGELSLEGDALNRTRSVVVMIVQAGFTDCHHPGIVDSYTEPLVGGCVPLAGRVRMDARSCGQPGLRTR